MCSATKLNSNKLTLAQAEGLVRRKLAELELEVDRQQGWVRGGTKGQVLKFPKLCCEHGLLYSSCCHMALPLSLLFPLPSTAPGMVPHGCSQEGLGGSLLANGGGRGGCTS